MNKKELIESISHLPSDCSGPSPMINKLAVLEFIKSLDEPQKVTVPQFVADWIEVCKEHLTSSLYLAMTPSFLKTNNQGIELTIWIKKNEETFARAWLDGYEVEKEKKYSVRIKNIQSGTTYLKYDRVIEKWYFGIEQDSVATRLYHTKEELEEAGFGWVFDCEGVEVEEVEG